MDSKHVPMPPLIDSRASIAARAVERLKVKLLDLTLRNKLLNFRNSPTETGHAR